MIKNPLPDRTAAAEQVYKPPNIVIDPVMYGRCCKKSAANLLCVNNFLVRNFFVFSVIVLSMYFSLQLCEIMCKIYA